MTNSNLLMNALNLAKMGISVFPCMSSKAPAIKGGFKSASNNSEEVIKMFSEPGVALIGVPTGNINGFDVIDIDPKNGGTEWYETNKHNFSECRTHHTRSGGWHFLLEHKEGMKNSASKIAPGVDVRGDGGYIIWWPAEGHETDNVSTMEWPEQYLNLLAEEKEVSFQSELRIENDSFVRNSYAQTALENECNNIRNAVPGTFNQAINKAAYSIGGFVTSGDIDEGQAYNALEDALQSILSMCKDKRKAQKTLKESFDAGKSKSRMIPEMEQVRKSEEFREEFEKKEKRSERKMSFIRKVSDKEIIEGATGVLAEFVNICVEGARRPHPLAAVISGICMIGALSARNVKTYTGLTTNLYSMMIMDSGAGKDRARGVIKDILLSNDDLTKFMAAESFASAPAIETALLDFPAKIAMWDEVGDLIAEMNNKNSTKKPILRTLKTLYTSCGSKFLGTSYANTKERQQTIVMNPCLCVIGTTTPTQLWGNLSIDSLEDGLMARFLIMTPEFQYTTNPDPSKVGHTNIRPEFIEQLCTIARGPNNTPIAHINSSYNDPMHMAGCSDEARKYIKNMEDRDTEMLIKNQGTWLTSIIARLTENAQKIALIRAISRGSYTVELEDIKWGEAIAIRSAEEILSQAQAGVAESANQKIYLDISKILKTWVKNKSSNIMSQSDITRAIRSKFTKREIEEVINSMIESGDISATVEETGGRRKNVYKIML